MTNKPKVEQAHGRTDFWMKTALCQWNAIHGYRYFQ